jgi:hypothetical protein
MSEKARTAAEDRADAMDSVAGNCADCGEPARGTWGGDAFCAVHMRAALDAEDLHGPPVVPVVHPRRTGAERIAAERARQIDVKGWSSEHDDNEHDDDSLAMAAACYAAPDHLFVRRDVDDGFMFAYAWPWGLLDDKRPHPPSDATPAERIRLLEKAGALIAAEIDRLLRAEERQIPTCPECHAEHTEGK